MRSFLFILFCVFFSSLAFGYIENEDKPLFEMDGKKYSYKDLSTTEKDLLYNEEFKNYKAVSYLLEEALLEEYYSSIATKKKMTVEQVAEKELKVSDPTEKEMKRFYTDKKSLIPAEYSYDQLKPRIKEMLLRQKIIEKRDELVAKLKKKQNFKLLIKEPSSANVDIDTKGLFNKGTTNSSVTVVGVCDYKSAVCKYFNESFGKIIKKEKINFVFIPLNVSKSEFETNLIKSGFCAGQQGKYWNFHDLVYKKQSSLSDDKSISAIVKELKLDTKKYDSCLSSEESGNYVNKVKELATTLGVSSVPMVFINNKKYIGTLDNEKEISAAIAKEKAIASAKK